MTNDEILKLAKEAGFWGVDEWFKAALPRFAVMIDKAQEIERDKWIRGISIKIPTETMENEINVHVRRAVEAEREACAKEAERMVMYPGGRCEAPAHSNVWDAAKAIRARGNKG
jgi:hypothetical protein